MSWGIPKPKSAPTKRLLALGLGVTLGFSAICGGVLWTMGQRDFEHNRAAAANLVASIASEIDRNIELYDLSLQAVVHVSRPAGIKQISPELTPGQLVARAATAHGLCALS